MEGVEKAVFNRQESLPSAPEIASDEKRKPRNLPSIEKWDEVRERVLDIKGKIRGILDELKLLGEDMTVIRNNGRRKPLEGLEKKRYGEADWNKVYPLLSEMRAMAESELSSEDKKVLELLNELVFWHSHLSDEEVNPSRRLLEEGRERIDSPANKNQDVESLTRQTNELNERLKIEMRGRSWDSLHKLGKGRYGVLKRMGAGGMGGVYLAWDINMNNFVVIKEVLPTFKNDRGLMRRFQREFLALSSVESNFVVKPVDIVEMSDEEGDYGLVMKYVEGQELEKLYDSGEFSIGQTNEIDKKIAQNIVQVLFGLMDIHKKGLTHRDLKLNNVIVTKNGVKIIDFGLVSTSVEAQKTAEEAGDQVENTDSIQAATEREISAKLTIADSPVGTPAYAAPESLAGKITNDPRSDLYCVGVMMYVMLTNNYPINDLQDDSSPKSPVELLEEKKRGKIPNPQTYRDDLDPSALETVIMRLLRPQEKERPKTARETAELILGAMVSNYSEDIVNDENFRGFFEYLNKRPEVLEQQYINWLKTNV